MTEVVDIPKPAARLEEALQSDQALLDDFRKRGWQPAGDDELLPDHSLLRGSKLLKSPDVDRAPKILFLWRESFGKRAVYGNELRRLQFKANEYRDRMLANHFYEHAPDLCAVGCSHFLMLFPVDGNPYTRRVRYTPDLLRHGSEALARQFIELDAESLAELAEQRASDNGDDVLAKLRAAGPKVRRFDWSDLYVGRGLDEEFVAFMGVTRRHITSILLDPDHRAEVLLPVIDELNIRGEVTEEELADDGYPTLEALARLGRLRNRLIATVDTVLLRLVLYRYLEAQFGYEPSPHEEREIALGSYDELLDDTTRPDNARLNDLLSHARKAYGIQAGSADDSQLDLFGESVRVTEPDDFDEGVRERHDFHGGTAGGDLHQGEVARAADVLQDYLIEHCREDIAALLEGTRADRYSFNYADLDPRAFQRFYEDTIGTDIRVRYEPETGRATVGVEDWSKNQKEQGAFYTDEKMAEWLVERTLGRRIEQWHEEFMTFLREESHNTKGRLPRLRQYLDDLLYIRVLDFACGGGIFLRSAFELLSKQRRKVAEALESMLPQEVYRRLTSESPYDLFGPGVETGRWEWHVLLNCLYGVDLDVKAINVASNLLTLSALTYKPHGVSFPSFINTNLKVGNAFVIPLSRERREEFPEVYGDQIRELIQLRKKLRNPRLSRDEWRRHHRRATEITNEVLDSQIVLAFGDTFPDLSDDEVIDRVRSVGCFLYELEFPEAFFDEDGTWRDNPGFDVVVGNPPWEEPAAEYKQFLPEFDPEYLSLSGAASKRREKELMSNPEIERRWEAFCDSVDDYRTLLTAGFYDHQVVEVEGRKYGAHSNLYKYAVELAHHLVGPDGDVGQVLDSGLWHDLSATGLRQLLLDEADVRAVCGFTNNEGLFEEVHRSYKFCCTVFHTPGPTELFPVIFMRRTLNALDNFEDEAVDLTVEDIREHPSDSYPVPEVRSEEHWESKRALELHPRLKDEPWTVDTYSRELNEGEQRHFFKEQPDPGDLPLIKGAQFNLWGVHQGSLPESWVSMDDDGAGGFLRARQEKRIHRWIARALKRKAINVNGSTQKERALNWLESVTGAREIPEEWFRLDVDGYRIAWRDVARNDDRRTLIAAIVPRRVALTDKAPFIRPFKLTVREDELHWKPQYSLPALLYLAGMLSSFACDSISRTRVAKTNFSSKTFRNLHVPPWDGGKRQHRIAELCARLTCLPATEERPWADYTELAAAVDLTPEEDGLIDPDDRRDAEVELNALAAEEYGLGAREFEFLMNELFMTPKHKQTHAEMRDGIARLL